ATPLRPRSNVSSLDVASSSDASFSFLRGSRAEPGIVVVTDRRGRSDGARQSSARSRRGSTRPDTMPAVGGVYPAGGQAVHFIPHVPGCPTHAASHSSGEEHDSPAFFGGAQRPSTHARPSAQAASRHASPIAGGGP